MVSFFFPTAEYIKNRNRFFPHAECYICGCKTISSTPSIVGFFSLFSLDDIVLVFE